MKSTLLLAQFVSQSPNAVAMFDLAMRYVAASPRWYADFSLTGALEGRLHYEVFPDIPEAWRALHQRALAGETITSARDVFLRENGESQVLRWQIEPWRHRDQSIGGILIFSEDITAAEADQRRIAENEHRLKMALRAANAGAWQVDTQTGQVVWSDEMWRLYGLQLGTTPSLEAWLQSVLPAERDAQMALVREVFARRGELTLEWQVNDPSGAERWLMSRAAPLLLEGREQPVYHGVVLDITERKLAEQRIHHAAHHDALTGLANRLAFNRHLAETAARGGELGLLCIDLDFFKEVNDAYGHGAGDAVLRVVGQRLEAACGARAMVARIGGDEFAAVALGEVRAEGLKALGFACIEAMRPAVDYEGTQLSITLSIGAGMIVEPSATPAQDAEILVARGDAALRRAKSEGRNRVCCYDKSLDEGLRTRHGLLHDLPRALAQGQFYLEYQPQWNGAGQATGFEALARWRHPVLGDIAPKMFIPIAEQSAFIQDIGEYLLELACAEAAGWRNPLGIAVNISSLQLRGDDLPGRVAAVLARTGLAPARLELEITEGVFVHDFAHVCRVLGELRAMGVRIAMDDFGTGYSCLAYLQNLQLDRIKIAGEFVAALENSSRAATVVCAIIGLGQGLMVPMIAEGVETEVQLAILREAGCQDAQGFLLGRPAGMEAYAELVRAVAPAPGDVARGSDQPGEHYRGLAAAPHQRHPAPQH